MTGTGPDEAAVIMQALARDVVERLARLRRELEPARELWDGGRAVLDPATEWTIAADGLLGRDGVIGVLSDAMKITWPGATGVGWADVASTPSGPHGPRMTD